MIRRLVVLSAAVGFCLADWLLDRLNRHLVDAQEPFRVSVDDLLYGPYEPAPWLAAPMEAP